MASLHTIHTKLTIILSEKTGVVNFEHKWANEKMEEFFNIFQHSLTSISVSMCNYVNFKKAESSIDKNTKG